MGDRDDQDSDEGGFSHCKSHSWLEAGQLCGNMEVWQSQIDDAGGLLHYIAAVLNWNSG